MKILITGNQGYVGPVLARHLRQAFGAEGELIGFDCGYFAHCLTGVVRSPESWLDQQWVGDIRTLSAARLAGFDAVVHLAAISNDPMGNRFERVTDEINHQASVRLARLAAAAGVRAFVFASSCSMYGAAQGGPRQESDTLNPLTAYARSKVATEAGLAALEAPGMTITALRFATACGMSDRLRLDLVLNDFVASAVVTRKITVLSDGTPWRPLIDVQDMSRAIEWAIRRSPQDGGRYLAINAGSNRGNYQVRDLAQVVARAIPGTTVSINENAAPDTRSYQVNFGLYQRLAPGHQPLVTIEDSVADLRAGLERMHFADSEFRNSPYMRLRCLEGHIGSGRLSPDLRWS